MNALVPINAQPAFTMGDVERIALAIAKGGMFGSKDPNAVLTLCLLAQAEGQHPAVVFRDYHIISGKPAKKADAMLRDFISAGGKVEWHTLDDNCADATFSHPGGGTVRISWDRDRVKRAQLGNNAMHSKYPRQMLRARVISEGVRTVYPGATSGLYEADEVRAFASEAPAEEVPHDDAPQNGRIHEAEYTEAKEPDEPAPREKLEGKHSSKTALGTALKAFSAKVIAAQSVRELDAIERDYADDLAQGRRYLPKWIDGDPSRDNKGIAALCAEKRDVLGLIESMESCDTKASLDKWMIAAERQIEELNDVQRREFERSYEAQDAKIQAMDQVTAGA